MIYNRKRKIAPADSRSVIYEGDPRPRERRMSDSVPEFGISLNLSVFFSSFFFPDSPVACRARTEAAAAIPRCQTYTLPPPLAVPSEKPGSLSRPASSGLPYSRAIFALRGVIPQKDAIRRASWRHRLIFAARNAIATCVSNLDGRRTGTLEMCAALPPFEGR